MPTNATHIARIIYRSFDGELNEDELGQLQRWLAENNNNRIFYNSLKEGDEPDMHVYSPAILNDASKEITRTVEAAIGLTLIPKQSTRVPVHRIHFLRTAWFRYAAAIIICFSIGAYLWFQNDPASTADNSVKTVKNDILPGGNKAILKLADGSEIILDNAAKGILAEESGATIKKTADGNIEYTSTNPEGLMVSYNTMSTPRGGQYQLMLPDGSKVWLNAESSITFPTAFNANNREVTISGEVYFEIEKNKEKPFIVKAGKDEITVLGTSFNINAYPDNNYNKTSLIDGAVKVNDIQLKPGQAYFKEKIITTNIAQDIAWKNGVFNFENLTMQQAMGQLSRWYDVTIKYQGEMRNLNFKGSMERALKLSEVMEGLEGFGGLHFELEGKILIVSIKK